jgi:transposase
MVSLPAGARIFLACGTTDMRKAFDGLVAQVERVLGADPMSALCSSSEAAAAI